MTDLNKTIRRETRATIFSKGNRRPIIIHLESSQKIAFQLKGTRDRYRLDPETCYAIAVRFHLERIERLAKKIKKEEGIKISSARVKARKELKGEVS